MRGHVFRSYVQSASTGVVARALSLGKLVGLDWKVGVALESSTCKTLNAPFVTVVLRVQHESGDISSHPMELSLGEYQSFAKSFRAIDAVMDTL